MPAAPEAPRARPPRGMDEALIDLIPVQGEWDVAGYLWLSELRPRLVEFVDGHIEVPPMPGDHHQTILGRLWESLTAHARTTGGKALMAPMPMRTIQERFREPDLMFLRRSDDPRRGKHFWTGADLVVEIVSPTGRNRDIVDKRAEYAATGIPEYWIIDPDDETVTVLALNGDVYVVRTVFRPGDMAEAATLPGFTVDVSALLAED